MKIEKETLVLSDRRGVLYVPWPLYRRYLDEILIVVPGMIPKVRYESEHLLGAEIWSGLDAGARRVAGRYISHMARRGELPLRRVGCRHQHPVQYELDT